MPTRPFLPSSKHPKQLLLFVLVLGTLADSMLLTTTDRTNGRVSYQGSEWSAKDWTEPVRIVKMKSSPIGDFRLTR